MDLSTSDDIFELFLKSVAQKRSENRLREPRDELIGEINALKRLRRDLDGAISQRWHQRNSERSFIYRLPLELLVRVFQLTLPQGNYTHDIKLQLLRSVSWLWRTTVDSTPSLWRLVSGVDHRQHLERAILHSERVPLDVIWDFQDANKLHPVDFFEKVGPEIIRWRSATLRLGSHHALSNIQEALGKPAPLLEELVIDFGDENGGMSPWGPIQLFGGASAPRLRALWIRKFEVVPSAVVFASLHVLHLHWIRLSYSQLRDLMKSCPLLEDLSLAGLMPLSGNNQFITSVSPSIDLPNLRKVSINHLDHKFTRFIFALINAPELDDFNLAVDVPPRFGFRWHGVFTAPELSQFVGALKLGAWAISVTIKTERRYKVVCEGASTLSFEMSSEQDLQASIEILKGILGDSISLPVYLNFDDYDFTELTFHTLWPVIKGIPNITSVLITSSTSSPQLFMMQVAQTNQLANDYASDPWLRLRHFRIHAVDPNILGYLIEMVRCRTRVLTAFATTGSDDYQVIEEVHVGEKLPAPPAPSEAIFRRLYWLQHAMPYGTVYWYGIPVVELS
ncbi:hypothetical protein FS837_012670 [Tulasnella sp. UAMH 9824]|nr:hypothetical protein FS837_012670 [Tulasnella sp. UAMH 9824]